MALEVAHLSQNILGTNRILRDYPVFRPLSQFRNSCYLQETHAIHSLILGQSITGISAFE
jgi:glutaryl-CoA dehydrogenase